MRAQALAFAGVIIKIIYPVIHRLNPTHPTLSNRPLCPIQLGLRFLILYFLVAGTTPAFSDSENLDSTSLKNPPPWLFESFTPTGDIRRYAGETIKFDIDFMVFSNAAEVQISLYEEDGKLKSSMVGETKGFIGFMTSYVKHIYLSTFDIIDDGKRLRTSTFERKIIVGENTERIVHAMDYHAMKHYYFYYKNGELIEQSDDPLDKEVILDDTLATFYNFRNGVYGKIEAGKSYTASTFDTKKLAGDTAKTITIKTLTHKARKKFEEDHDSGPGASMLMEVMVPSDLFETKNGETYFWSSEHLVPTKVIIKDFILFGDMNVKLAKRLFREQDRSPAEKK